MNEPNDFDPTQDPLAASLKRQFAPPSLDALNVRIAAEAARVEAESKEPDGGENEAPANPAPANEPNRGRWIVAAAFLAAAAVVLLIARPWDEGTTPSTSPPVAPPIAPPIARTQDPLEVVPPTTSERAGYQLDGFLRRGDVMATLDACGPLEPPEVCSTEADYPHLPPGLPVTQLGECGGGAKTSCAEVDLPADRALLVQLSTGDRAIVCIEHPWTDPKPTLPPGSRYNIFRRELGEYILYEITPLSEPEAASLIRL